MANETDFSDVSATNLQYDWSNTNNWSNGLPVDGDDVVVNGTGEDDLASLSLNDLTLAAGSAVEVLDSLVVSDVIDDGGELTAFGLGSAADVTVDTATGPVDFSAFGAAVFTDDSPDDYGTYAADAGGKIVVDTTLGSNDAFAFSDGTIVLAGAQAGTITSQLENLGSGDTIALPGTAGSLSQVSFATGALSVTTSAGTFDFTNVTYTNNVLPGGYNVSYDAGLVSITLEPPVDAFSDNTPGSSYTYDWNTAANWSSGAVPPADSGVQTNANGYDNIASFSVDNLYLNGYTTDVVANGLEVDDLISNGGSLIADESFADAKGGFGVSSVTVTIVADSGGAVDFGATGVGGLFTDESTTDSGTYSASDGGQIVVTSNPASDSTFTFGDGGGTIALRGATPGTISSQLQGFEAGDTLELPGNDGAPAQASFTTGGLTVTTSSGTFVFTDVTYGTYGAMASGFPAGYTIGYDPNTNLVSIQLQPLEVFTPTDYGISGAPWDDGANWTGTTVPAAGSEVQTDGNGNDNISSYSVGNLYLNGYTTNVVANTLTVADVISSGGALIADESLAGEGGKGGYGVSSVSVTVEADGGGLVDFGATGTGGLFTDESTTDSGTFSASLGGKIIVSSNPASGSTFSFPDGVGTIAFAGAVAGTISSALQGLGNNDILELPGDDGSVSQVSFTADGLSITTSAGTFNFDDVSYAKGVPPGYSVGYDATTRLDSVTIACYLRGTNILSEHGEVAIETLRIDNRVRTRDGTLKPIKWIGRRRFSGDNLDVQPILIRAGALSPDVPRRDLYVSPEHAMFIDRVLIPATDLVNGVSIVKLEDLAVVEYFHIELETHDVIYAEGAASESFVDDDSRRMFQNAQEFRALYPNDYCMPPVFCASRLSDGFELEAIRERLTLRACAMARLPMKGKSRCVMG